MKKINNFLLWIFLFSNVLFNANISNSKEIDAQSNLVRQRISVERTIDGDTFVGNGTKIRLWGIDTPEKYEAGYLAAKLYLEVLLDKQYDVACIYKDRDRYKRFVMQCFSDGKDIAESLVFMGLAKDYRRYSGGYYSDIETIAKDRKFGIWK